MKTSVGLHISNHSTSFFFVRIFGELNAQLMRRNILIDNNRMSAKELGFVSKKSLKNLVLHISVGDQEAKIIEE